MAPKRNANQAQQKGQPIAKKSRSQGMFDIVAEALGKSSLPEGVREMLVAAIPHTLGVAPVERHSMQAGMIAMMEEAIDAGKVDHQAAVGAAAAELAVIEGSRAERASQVAEAEADAAAATEEAHAKKVALAAVAREVASTRIKVQEASAAKAAGEKEAAAKKKEVENLETVALASFNILLEGSWGPEGPAQHQASLMPALRRLDLEASLVDAAPACCSKAPSDRSSFDAMVFQELQKGLSAQAQALQKKCEELTEAALASAAAAETANSELAAVLATQRVAADDLSKAMKASTEAAAALRKAQDALAAFDAERAVALAKRQAAQEELETYLAFHVACFQELKSPTVKAKADVAAAEAPAKADVAAAEAVAEAQSRAEQALTGGA